MFPANIDRRSPSRRRTWSARPSHGKPKKGILKNEPEDYFFQVEQLKSDLNFLREKKHLFRSGANSYLELGLFPSSTEVKQDLLTFFRAFFSLEFIKLVPNGIHSSIFFRILDFDALLTALSSAIQSFSDFSRRHIALKDFEPQRIILFRYFRLSTKETKEIVTPYLKDFDQLRLIIDYIEPIPDSITLLKSIAHTAGLNIPVSDDGVIYVSHLDQNDVRKVSDFASKVADLDQVERIYLDDFVSTIESPLTGGRTEIQDVEILSVGPHAPVIAVIDSGVQRNTLTRPFLTEEGLDYTGAHPDPFTDVTGHGTAVACEIVYGNALQDLFLGRAVSQLTPVAKIFPVRVFRHSGENLINYDHIFDINGEFARYVQKYQIKIVNISFSQTNPKSFQDATLSKEAYLMELFAAKYGVLFVVCVGNIDPEGLSHLVSKYPGLEFYSRPDNFYYHYFDGNKHRIENLINILPPADIISGVAVGSAHEQNDKFVVSSFSRSFSFPDRSRNKYKKPDLVSVGGGDFPFDKSTSPPSFSTNTERVAVATEEESYLRLQAGTSYSTPRVSRALGIAEAIYPNLDALSLKGLLMHRLSNTPFCLKKNAYSTLGVKHPEPIEFHTAFRGVGCLPSQEEDRIFMDSEDQVTYLVHGDISKSELLTYKLPIVRLIGDRTKKATNKLQLKISVCYPPTLSSQRPMQLIEHNLVHISATVHLPGFNLLNDFVRKGKTFRNQFVTQDDPTYKRSVLLPWTCDYYSHFFPVFSISERLILKDELYALLDDQGEVEISVRCYSKLRSFSAKPFVLIFSVEDLGATNQIRNHLNVQVTS